MKINLDDLEHDATGTPVGLCPADHLMLMPVHACATTTLALIERIRRLEIELARASGVARAHGAQEYADDFMRVALDREDFDAEVIEKVAKP